VRYTNVAFRGLQSSRKTHRGLPLAPKILWWSTAISVFFLAIIWPSVDPIQCPRGASMISLCQGQTEMPSAFFLEQVPYSKKRFSGKS